MTAAYFTDRCGVSIEVKRDTLVPCGLKHGHDGSHEPVKLGTQTVGESPAARIVPGCLTYSVSFSKRDWPWRPWRWKRVRETRHMRIGGTT